jgi:hypothetical protein
MNKKLVPFMWSSHVDSKVLAAGVAETYTLPTGARWVTFSGTDDFYVKPNAAATVPTGDTTDGSASSLNPHHRNCEGITTLGIISARTCTVTMEFYS